MHNSTHVKESFMSIHSALSSLVMNTLQRVTRQVQDPKIRSWDQEFRLVTEEQDLNNTKLE